MAGHATFLGVPRETRMAKTLYAVDELSGFIAACAYVRPDGIHGMTPKSVKKKLKQPSFAAGVNRDEVREGAEELGVDFDEHVAFVIARDGGARGRAGPGAARGRRNGLSRSVLPGHEHAFVSGSSTPTSTRSTRRSSSATTRRCSGRPVIVGPGVVLAASYEAKARGVYSGMGAGRARRLCPDAAVVPCRFEAYVEASKAVFEIFEDTAPTVEALSIDEAFLDVRGMEHFAGTPEEIAARLRRRVREEVGLPISVGVARHEVPGEGGERGGEAGRPAPGAARRRARVPASAAGGAAVGRRAT